MVRCARQWLVAAVFLVTACGKSETPPEPSSSQAPSGGAVPSGLSLEVRRQIQALLAEKDARPPAQQKIQSGLLFRIKMELGVPIAPGIDRLDSDVKVDSSGFVLVDIRARRVDSAAEAVEEVGGQVLARFPRFGQLTARVPLLRLEEAAEDPDVIFVEELVDPDNNESPEASRGNDAEEVGTDAINTSQGVVTHQINVARTTYGALGQGVKIGVLSDSVDFLSVSQSTGDVGPVTVLPGQSGIPGTGEGTAMLEIVYDVVPEAELYFATAFGSSASFANNILALRAAGCDIIVDDVFYFNESPFQDAIIAQAVNSVIASGAIYMSSAGNAGSVAKGTAGVYEGNFVDGGTIGAIPAANGNVTLFNNGVLPASNNNLITFVSGTRPVTLFWSDRLGASSNDYDLFILNNALSSVVSASTTNQTGSQDPFETVGTPTVGNRAVVTKRSTAAARYLHLNMNRGRLERPTVGQTKGHGSAMGAFAVAATPAATAIGAGNPSGPYPNPFTSANVLELFSSDGPRRVFYNQDGTLANTGNPSLLGDGGVVRQKPDLTAADGVSTSVPGFTSFFGTSASAPHLAAMAALLKSAVPSATPAQIRTALTSSAIDIEGAGVEANSGAGIAMAPAALMALGAVPRPTLLLGTRTVSPLGGNMNAFWEPGESATLNVVLSNAGAATATSVNATLSTTTAGVTITQAASAYPNIAVSGNGTNTTPFGLSLAESAACGSVPVRLALTYTGGSATFDFHVDVGAAGSPVVVAYSGPVVPIGDALTAQIPGPIATASVALSGFTGNISDLNFRIDGTMNTPMAAGLDHTFVGDLGLSLTSPTGTTVSLVNRLNAAQNSGNNFFATVLDDEGVTSIQAPANTAPFTGTFKPDEALSAFRHQNPNGTWLFRARDFGPNDTGTIRAFSLVVTPRVCASAPDLGDPCDDDSDCDLGHCSDGVCCDMACGDSNPSDCQACSPSGQCTALPAATVCRASQGVCDVVEACDGTAMLCPADGVAASGTVCRPSANACDVAETCSGTSPTCGADAAVTPGTACGGAPSGACDAQDTCSGSVGATATCVSNFQAATVECRASTGGCDPAENCTGSSATCPGDVLASNGTVCRPAANDCDVAETCNGTTATCGADAAVTPGTACGGAPSGVCDAQDTCSGTVGATASCTANYQPSSLVCRPSGGVCDVAENCTGSSASCPSDVLFGTSTVCRPSVGACDAAEACTGASATCGADAAVTPGTACGGAPSGVCDAQDTCSGTVGATATCSVNYQPTSAVCRPSGGACDVAENCTGSSTSCPSDVLFGTNTVCRPSVGACDVAETCSGSSATCGADAAVTPGTACGGAPSGVCDAQDTCAGTVGATASCAANYQPSSLVCRPSGGVCDVAENCTGSSTSCPADVLLGTSTVCRPSVGACDAAEACSGSSATCGADAAVTPGTACGGAPSGACDAQDTCTGSVGATATCVANYQPSSVVCRPSGGVCDVGENCTGSTTSCPADVLLGTSTVCRPSVGACDVAEACSGSSATCGADAAVTPGTACGGAPSGLCDAQDTCSGTVGATASCTSNYQPSSLVCRPSGGVCDVAENCTGSTTSCPADVLLGTSTVCRPSVGACDVAEACSGSSPTCGADAAVTPGTACGGAPSGDCDVQDTCAGTLGATASCAANYQPSSVVCRPSGGDCDVVENCTGSAPTCPSDGFATAGTQCRAAVGACDLAESCTGTASGCPVDGFAPSGAACGDGNACTANDQCNGSGACQPGSPVDCTDANPCTSERCDSELGCILEPVTDGTACDDGSACTLVDACASGQCRGGMVIDCNDDNPCTTDTCNPSVACEHTPVAAGTACDDGNQCTAVDACNASGLCVVGNALDCDDGNECTADSCDTGTGCAHTTVRDGTRCAGGDGVCRRGDCDTGAGGAGGVGGEGADGTGGNAGRGGSSGRGGSAGRGVSGEAGAASGGTAGSGEGGEDSGGEAGSGGSRRRGGHTTQTSGCGCRVVGKSDPGAPHMLWLALPLLVALRRRRQAKREAA